MWLGSPLRPSTTMYEMYVQPRDVYTANKDGVSVFISTAWTGASFPVLGAGTELEVGAAEAACSPETWASRRPRRGTVCVPWTWLWAWDAPKKHRYAPGRHEALTFL